MDACYKQTTQRIVAMLCEENMHWHIRKPLVERIAQEHSLMTVSVSDAHNIEILGLRYTEVNLDELHEKGLIR